MANNPALDDALIEEVLRVGHHATRKEAVTCALEEQVERHKQREIVKLFGTIEFDCAYDVKANRLRDRTERTRKG